MSRAESRNRTALARGAADRIDASATRFASALARRRRELIVTFVAVLVATTAVLAESRPLWNDELFTHYVAGLPTARGVWSELATGAEQTPYLFYLITRASLAVFGEGELAIRVPAILGFSLMSVCLYLFVARRSAPVYGFVALLFPLATAAYSYAYEARAYALVLGFGALALVAWQRAAEARPRRRLAAVLLALSLALAVGSHYYAILLLVPLTAAEISRAISRRRVDWLIAASFGGALVPLILFAPLVQAAREYATTFWARPDWLGVGRFYVDFLFDPRAIVAMAVGTAVAAFIGRRRDVARHAEPTQFKLHERVAIWTLALLPIFAVLLGKLFTDAYTERYALSAVLGLAVLLASMAWRLDEAAPVVGVAMVILLSAIAVGQTPLRYQHAVAEQDRQQESLSFLQRHHREGTAIVVSSPHDFFELSHRAAEGSGLDLLYLADPKAALRYLDTDAVDLGVIGMADVAPLHVEPFGSFVASHRRFVVFGQGGAWDWLTPALRARGADLEVLEQDSRTGDVLIDVTL